MLADQTVVARGRNNHGHSATAPAALTPTALPRSGSRG
ncbi:hypothetical protein ACFWBB_38545 [Streptomyces sp. NPDC060000]